MACIAILWIGGGSLVLSLLGELTESERLRALLGWAGILQGVVFVVLGVLTKRGSRAALWIATVPTALLVDRY